MEEFFKLINDERIENAIHKDCKIEVNQIDGIVQSQFEGDALTLLIVFATLQKVLLEKVGLSKAMFDMLQERLGTMEV